MPPTPAHGYIESTSCDSFYNNVTTYKCNDGYRLVGEPQLTCGKDGMWRPTVAPTCEGMWYNAQIFFINLFFLTERKRQSLFQRQLKMTNTNQYQIRIKTIKCFIHVFM